MLAFLVPLLFLNFTISQKNSDFLSGDNSDKVKAFIHMKSFVFALSFDHDWSFFFSPGRNEERGSSRAFASLGMQGRILAIN